MSMTHAGHYAALGNNWYGQFVNAEVNEVRLNILNSANLPYGNGSNTFDSPIIALGESWAYHMGQYLAGRQYGTQSTCAGEQTPQGPCYYNNYIPGLNSHQIASEDYDPNLPGYSFDWIPKGLYYDMMDTRNETIPVIDQVSGYTNQQFFNAFNSSITSLGAYRQNLLSQNGNNQSLQVTYLFQQYGY